MNENEKKLIELLQQKNPQSASELSEQLNVSNRTVYRWAEKLAEKGLKITSTKGRNGGIFLEDVNIDLSRLEEEESPKEDKPFIQVSTHIKDEYIFTLPSKLLIIFNISIKLSLFNTT
jgi:transcriptional antiterminator